MQPEIPKKVRIFMKEPESRSGRGFSTTSHAAFPAK